MGRRGPGRLQGREQALGLEGGTEGEDSHLLRVQWTQRHRGKKPQESGEPVEQSGQRWGRGAVVGIAVLAHHRQSLRAVKRRVPWTSHCVLPRPGGAQGSRVGLANLPFPTRG